MNHRPRRLITRSVPRRTVRSGIQPGGRRDREQPAPTGPQPPVLRASVGPFESLIQNASDMFSVVDPQGVVLYASPSVERLTGFRADEFIGQDGTRWIHPDDRRTVRRALLASMRSPGSILRLETRFLCREGSWIDLDIHATNLLDDPSVGGIVLNSRDISDRKQAEMRLRETEARYRTLVEQLPLVIYTVANDATHTPLYMSPQFEAMFGFPASDWLHDPSITRSRVHPDDRERTLAILATAIATGAAYQVEYRMFARDGRTVWVRDEAVLVGDASGEGGEGGERYWQGFLLDISEKKLTEEHLLHQAFHDPLTGLPNRALLMDRIAHALARGQRSGTTVALLFVDLDNFKVVNDSLGHEAGDKLLIAIAGRLGGCVRPGDTVARLGGDEFTILLEDVANEDEAIRVAQRVAQAFEDGIALDEHMLRVTASIGIATAEDGNAFASDLVRNADIAMYDAKRQGKARYQAFSPAMVTRAHQRLDLEIELRQAIERNELIVYYQPILDLERGVISSVEALVRWLHPERGLILPDAFISLAEETGQIVEIGEWVLREACSQVREWDATFAGDPLSVSVNLSPRQFRQGSFVKQVADILRETGLAPERLTLEITEGVIMEDSEATIATLTALRTLGVQIAIDDFGTGYSSLAYLKRYPVDTLKIDRAFIHRLGENREDTAIVDAVIAFATSLGLRVTAEGIETLAQLDHLRARHCHEGQGYLFARPVPSAALLDLLRNQPTESR